MKRTRNFKENNLFFAMGVTVALSVLLVAFEWSSNLSAPKNYATETFIPEEIDINLTQREPEPPKPQIEQPTVVISTDIEVVNEPVEHQNIFTGEDAQNLPQVIAAVATAPRRVEKPDESIFDFAEIAPEYMGGSSELMKFLSGNIRYPQSDLEMEIQGRVVCTFVVEKDGSITDIQVLRGVSPGIDREAIRVISEMPKWKPGFQNGRTVRVKYTLPIQFRIKR